MFALRFISLSAFLIVFAAAQINSIINGVTSDVGSVFSDATSAVASVATNGASHVTSIGGVITSAAGDVEEKVTSVGGSVFTVVTSDGGKAVTLGENGVGTAVNDLTQFYQSATSAAATLATGKSSALSLHAPWSMTLLASFGAVVGGVAMGVRMVL